MSLESHLELGSFDFLSPLQQLDLSHVVSCVKCEQRCVVFSGAVESSVFNSLIYMGHVRTSVLIDLDE